MSESVVEHPTPEPSRSRRTGRRRRPRSDRARRQKGLRAVYFSLAALWGSIAGSAAVLAAASFGGQRVPFSGGLIVALLLALLAAVAGGLVSAAAYREARKR